MILNTLPKDDGFIMPAEFSEHFASIMIWPTRAGSFPYKCSRVKPAFVSIIKAISSREKLFLICNKNDFSEISSYFSEELSLSKLELLFIPTDDAWARDTSPTFVTNGSILRGLDWVFNAWGGEVDGLLPSYKNDDALALSICNHLKIDSYDLHPLNFVLEGGSIHSDGEGTIMVTSSCLLSAGRNPKLSKQEIEEILCSYLGAKKVLWLPHGIYNDETNEHIDNICAFVSPAEVVLAFTEDKNDPQYSLSMESYNYLLNETDALGRKIKIHKLPIPKKPVTITEEDLRGFDFEFGETERHVGERLAASYVNFYIINGAVLVPQFNDENDALAVSILSKLFTNRDIIPIDTRQILLGGGNIHCLTSQIPAVKEVNHNENG